MKTIHLNSTYKVWFKNLPGCAVRKCESVLNKLSKVLTSANERFRAIRKLEKQMATYGLAPTPDREDAFNCMIKGLGGFISAEESERVLLTAYLRGTTSSQGIDDLLKLDHYGLINRMNGGEAWTDLSEECLQDLNRSWDKMIENQKAFLGTNSQIGKLFIVRL